MRIECDENETETKIFERDLTCKFKKSKIYSKQEKSLSEKYIYFPNSKIATIKLYNDTTSFQSHFRTMQRNLISKHLEYGLIFVKVEDSGLFYDFLFDRKTIQILKYEVISQEGA